MSMQAGYIKYGWREKVPQVLWLFHSKRIRTNCLPRGLLWIPLCLSMRSCGIVSETSHYLPFHHMVKVWRAEHITPGCGRALCRLTFLAELTHWQTDAEYESSMPHPKVSITIINKSGVEAESNTKHSRWVVMVLQGFCSTKWFNPEITASD